MSGKRPSRARRRDRPAWPSLAVPDAHIRLYGPHTGLCVREECRSL
jgi:hypothetical protein